MELIAWCRRRKKKIPVKEQEGCLRNCNFNCVCPDTVLFGEGIKSDIVCSVHNLPVPEERAEVDYCINMCGKAKKVVKNVSVSEQNTQTLRRKLKDTAFYSSDGRITISEALHEVREWLEDHIKKRNGKVIYFE